MLMASSHAVHYICFTLATLLCAQSVTDASDIQIGRVETFIRKDVVLPHKRDGTSVIPLNFTFTFPGPHAAPLDLAKHPKLPLVLLLNGASVESFWYRRVIGDLASKGFVVASTDYYRPIPSGSPFKPKPGCRPQEFVEVSARLINTLYAFVHSASGHPSAETVFLRLADTDELLLLSHSLGGSVAFSVLTGECEGESKSGGSCEGYEPIMNSKGKDVVIGTAVFEGYLAGSGFQPREMELKEGTFALFLSGQYNTATRKAFRGVVNQGSCASYVSFQNMTHFGMNDFVGPSEETHQVTPCAQSTGTDDPDFTTDKATQTAGIDLIADIIDAAVRLRHGSSKGLKSRLQELVEEERVIEGDVDSDCLSGLRAAVVS